MEPWLITLNRTFCRLGAPSEGSSKCSVTHPLLTPLGRGNRGHAPGSLSEGQVLQVGASHLSSGAGGRELLTADPWPPRLRSASSLPRRQSGSVPLICLCSLFTLPNPSPFSLLTPVQNKDCVHWGQVPWRAGACARVCERESRQGESHAGTGGLLRALVE